MKIDNSLKDYIEESILPLYENNFIGDDKSRIEYVMNRSKSIIKEKNLDIDNNILYTAICYHDIRKNNDEKEHELVSAQIMYQDEFLKHFFKEEQRIMIKEAIEDQRANSAKEPRNIYGKILSSASRNSSIEQCLKRSYQYGKKKNPSASDTELLENAYHIILNKFGKNGYAKFYFKDATYDKFLSDIRELLSDKNKFIERQKKYITELQDKNDAR